MLLSDAAGNSYKLPVKRSGAKSLRCKAFSEKSSDILHLLDFFTVFLYANLHA